jgi:predicted esterase
VPAFAYNGLSDDVIPYSQAATLRDAWCAQGTNLQWTDYPADHATGEFSAVTDVINWLDARFSDQPPTPTCNR